MYLFGIIFIFGTVFGNETHKSNVTSFWDASGDYPQPAIVDGHEVSLKEFPYAARLYTFRGREVGSCTSQIINPRQLITAAHCAAGKTFLIVVAGKADQRDYVEGLNLDNYVRYKVSKAYIHPLYNRFTTVHDVAILELAKPMTHPGYGILALDYNRLEKLSEATIFGWGETEKNKRNSQLFAKNLTVEKCTKTRDPKYEFICLKEPGSQKGDSGGPIIIDGKMRGVCSHSEVDSIFNNERKEVTFYTALWEEKEFLTRVINSANYNRSFSILITMSIIFII